MFRKDEDIAVTLARELDERTEKRTFIFEIDGVPFEFTRVTLGLDTDFVSMEFKCKIDGTVAIESVLCALINAK